MRRFAVLLALLFSLMVLDGCVGANRSKEVILSQKPKICSECAVLIYRNGGSSVMGLEPYGTGFFFRDKNGIYLVTAKHIAASKQPLFISYTSVQDSLSFTGVPINGSGDRWPDYFYFPGEDLDIAVLPVDNFRDYGRYRVLNSKDVKRCADLMRGEEVYFIGYPLYNVLNSMPSSRAFPLLRFGHISHLPEENLWGADPSLRNFILIDGTSVGGNSGGPAFSMEDGRLIGIVFGHLPDYKGQNANLVQVLPADYLVQLVSKIPSLKNKAINN